MPAEAPGYARPKSESRESVIVFIHGLHGEGRKTWTASGGVFGTAVAWPCLIMADQDVFRGSNVLLTSYLTDPAASNPSIADAARQLAHELVVVSGAFEYKHVTVVAHSMGGIVLARMLTTPGLLDATQRAKIRLIVFLGTPALPTEAAAVCDKFGVNRQCADMRDGAAMQALWQAWDALSPRPETWCVAEGADTWFPFPPLTLRIVPEASAHRPCALADRRLTAVRLDHSAMVKPASIAQHAHRDLQRAFGACVKPSLQPASTQDAAADAALAEPASTWFYALKDRLLRDPAVAPQVLDSVLESAVNRYWYPGDGVGASFDAAAFARQPRAAFVGQLAQQLPVLLPKAEFRWARPVSRVRTVHPDGAIDEMTRQMAQLGGLRPDDVMLGFTANEDVGGLPVLLLRPAGGRFALLGLLVVPPPQACIGGSAALALAPPH